ncbi:MAG: hypothetical protein AB7O92_01000 [Acidimicrobiia bacterium]
MGDTRQVEQGPQVTVDVHLHAEAGAAGAQHQPEQAVDGAEVGR